MYKEYFIDTKKPKYDDNLSKNNIFRKDNIKSIMNSICIDLAKLILDDIPKKKKHTVKVYKKKKNKTTKTNPQLIKKPYQHITLEKKEEKKPPKSTNLQTMPIDPQNILLQKVLLGIVKIPKIGDKTLKVINSIILKNDIDIMNKSVKSILRKIVIIFNKKKKEKDTTNTTNTKKNKLQNIRIKPFLDYFK
jgi:hypothetical protein